MDAYSYIQSKRSELLPEKFYTLIERTYITDSELTNTFELIPEKIDIVMEKTDMSKESTALVGFNSYVVLLMLRQDMPEISISTSNINAKNYSSWYYRKSEKIFMPIVGAN